MSDYYCKCKGCKYVDPNERSGYKWYCTWYRSYEDPDYVRECSHFESQDSSGGCFLTTACCQYKGLPDDCEELSALRIFRDTYLTNSDKGKELVKEYYQIAPGIVEKIKGHPEKNDIYEHIYSVICSVVVMLEHGMYGEAISAYKNMVLGVQSVVSTKSCN